MNDQLDAAREIVRRFGNSHEYLDRLSLTEAVFGSVLPSMIDALEVSMSLLDEDGKRKVEEALRGGDLSET